jgi:hypothetical protein
MSASGFATAAHVHARMRAFAVRLSFHSDHSLVPLK